MPPLTGLQDVRPFHPRPFGEYLGRLLERQAKGSYCPALQPLVDQPPDDGARILKPQLFGEKTNQERVDIQVFYPQAADGPSSFPQEVFKNLLNLAAFVFRKHIGRSYGMTSHRPASFSMTSGRVVYSISSIGSRWGSEAVALGSGRR